ncbi:MAG: hypothetical protein Q6354_01395 [Candidatus Brocadiales bacterium]|nr:hypothetical protein [Candidatus Brocadiales bacterium]
MALAILGYILILPLVPFVVYLKDQSLEIAIANIHNIFNTSLSFRYVGPVFPLVAILASGGFVSLENISWKKALISLCILQMFISTLYVYNSRRLAPPIKEAYEFIRINTPKDSSILTTNTDIVIHSGRKVMWSSDGTMQYLPYLFWEAKDNEAFEILKAYRITHLFILKSDIWDDSVTKNIGKYPKSFVNKLQSFSFLKCIFDSEAVSIWAVEPTYVSVDRRKDSVAQ